MRVNCRNGMSSSVNIWQIAKPHRFAGADAVLDDGVLAVQHVDELGVVAARHAGYPAGGGCSRR